VVANCVTLYYINMDIKILDPKEQILMRRLMKKDVMRPEEISIKRNSPKFFDISIEGIRHGDGYKCSFSSQGYRHVIHSLVDWCCPVVANMSDYPEMVEYGDWSGIRDSSEESIMNIFNWYLKKHPL
jgi:hypothetical protein